MGTERNKGDLTPYDRAKAAGVTTDMKIDADALVTVAVSRVEQQIIVLINDKTKSVRDLQKQIAELNKQLLTLVSEIAGHNEKLAELQREVIDLRKKRQELPTLERAAKARVVQAQLDKTCEGRELLEQLGLGGDLESEILKLPLL